MDKKSSVKRTSIAKKEKAIEEELKKEREHPEEIIKEEIEHDDSADETKEPDNPELDKSSKKLMLYAILGAVLIVGSIIAITSLIEVEETSYIYNGFSFDRYPGDEAWYTSVRIGDMIYPLPFHYGPKELEDIPYDIDEERLLSSEFIFLSIPPMDDESGAEARRMGQAAIEVGKIIGTRNNIFNIPARATLTNYPEGEEPPETEEGDTIPVVNCENVPDNSSAIMFIFGDFTGVYEETENCIVVQGTNGRDVIRAADRLAYGLLGIMA